MSNDAYDLIIRGGFVVDGTGAPRRRIDVGIRDGKIATLGHLDDATATEEIDATDMIVAPGIVDAHTHYDPQITFDPYATMSCFHGVTTVVAGNCGFSIAPTRAEHHDVIARTLENVEDMNVETLSAGIPWDFETFPEYLASVARLCHWNYRGHGRSAPPGDAGRIDTPTHADDLGRVRLHIGDGPVQQILPLVQVVGHRVAGDPEGGPHRGALQRKEI
jgi:N-acyl-D-aspartate/D-glutamate deacylase